jgi:hypothetical protein
VDVTDAEIVAREVARLRHGGTKGHRESDLNVASLKADILEAVPVELAARFLRECALAALMGTRAPAGESWLVSIHLQYELSRERRSLRRDGITWPGGVDVWD